MKALWALLGMAGIGAAVVVAATAEDTRRVARRAGAAAGRAAREWTEATMAELQTWIQTAIRMASAHEGKAWSVQKNLDGQGVSYGIIQWTQRGGGLGRILAAMHEADPDRFAYVFGPAWRDLLAATARASMDPVDGVLLWKEPWVSRFVEAGKLPVFQRVQYEQAAQSEYMRGALRIGRILGLLSERALVWYFDRCIHQGVAGATGPAERLAAHWQASGGPPEDPTARLAQYAWLCADRFRRTSPPPSERFSSRSTAVWKQIAREREILPDGRVVWTDRVAWHAFAGPWDLYDIIAKRWEETRTAPLSDAPATFPEPTA